MEIIIAIVFLVALFLVMVSLFAWFGMVFMDTVRDEWLVNMPDLTYSAAWQISLPVIIFIMVGWVMDRKKN